MTRGSEGNAGRESEKEKKREKIREGNSTMDKDSRGRGVHIRRQRHRHTLITNNTRQQRGIGSRGTKEGSKKEVNPKVCRCLRATDEHGWTDN